MRKYIEVFWNYGDFLNKILKIDLKKKLIIIKL